MARDYGRKKSPRHRGSVSKQLLLVLVCFLFGYLSASIFDFTSLSNWVNTTLRAEHTVQTAKKPVPQQAALPKPKFEFYTLLAKERVETAVPVTTIAAHPVAATSTSSVANLMVAKGPLGSPLPVSNVASARPPSSPVVNNKNAYLVQVGSFKSKQEAERVKASLTLKGFLVNVSAVTQQKTNWYRVTIGPFASRPEAIKAQGAVARSEHIVGMIRKMDA